MSMTRKRLIALLIASVLSIGAVAKLSGTATPRTGEAEAEETATSEMLKPDADSSTPPTWVLDD
jgi:hypothetical protein